MIKVIDIKKSFDKKVVLNQMSIDIELGTVFGLIGVNGSGKSTLLRLLSGVYVPDEGTIEVDGMQLTDSHFSRKDIFYLSDNPPHGNFTTFKDLYNLYATFYPMNIQIFNEVLDMFKLNAQIELSKCSKGMKRQGYLALAFATNAKYLLLDEAFDGLDPMSRLKFRKYLMKTFDEDRIMMISSHSLRELEDFCDSFGLIDDGHFKSYGNISQIVSNVKKYRIVAADVENEVIINENDFIYYKQDGRVFTVFEQNNKAIESLLYMENVLAIDVLDMTFEEYFMIQDEV